MDPVIAVQLFPQSWQLLLAICCYYDSQLASEYYFYMGWLLQLCCEDAAADAGIC